MSRRLRTAVLATCLLIGLPAHARLSATDPGGPPLQPFEYQPQLLSNGRYTEGWDHYFYFSDGTFLAAQFVFTNFGIGDHRGLVIGTLVRPDGRVLTLKNGRARDAWSYDPDRLDLRLASHQLVAQEADYRIYLKNSSGEIDVRFLPTTVPWRIGYTWEGTKGKHYQRVSVYAPHANATGRFRLGPREGGADNAPWTQLRSGQGFGLRYVNSKALSSMILDWLRVFPIHVDQDWQPVLNSISRIDGQRVSGLALFNGAEQQRTEELVVNIESTESDPYRGRVHQIPKKLSLRGEGQNFFVSGTMTLTRFLNRFDVVSELKPLERFIVQFITTPVHYRFLADYDLQYQLDGVKQSLHGMALVEFMSLQKRTVE